MAALTHRRVTLTFTAPGDDADRGTVVAYDLRQSAAAITDSTWANATKVPSRSPASSRRDAWRRSRSPGWSP